MVLRCLVLLRAKSMMKLYALVELAVGMEVDVQMNRWKGCNASMCRVLSMHSYLLSKGGIENLIKAANSSRSSKYAVPPKTI
eukprot:5240513-Amphidinium_carterae.1